MKTLVITVGGSCAPIITSIEQNKCDQTHFICSDDSNSSKGSYRSVIGEGKVCGKDPRNPDELNILEHVKIPKEKEGEIYYIHRIKNFDDLNDCYVESLNILKDIKEKNPGTEIIADYTGGTKSMSVGLGAASMDIGDVTICLVKGTRTDLMKVQNGTQRIRLSQTNIAYLNRQINTAENLINRYDYDGAINIFEEIIQHTNIPQEIDMKLQKNLVVSKALRAWDHIDHEDAWRLLDLYRKDFVKNIIFLEAVIWSRKTLDDKISVEGIGHRGCGYELVEDIVLNAERRAEQGKFDDAVARLYRALELLAQLRLKLEYSIDPGKVDIEKIPEIYRQEYEAKKEDGDVRISLKEDYELLSKMNNDDLLGKIYKENQNRLLDILKIRNYSLYAHGLNPISKEDYEKFNKIFVEDILDKFLSNFKKRVQRCQFIKI